MSLPSRRSKAVRTPALLLVLSVLLVPSFLVAAPASAEAPEASVRESRRPSPVADRVLTAGPTHRTALEVRRVRPQTFGVGEAKVRSYRARASVRLRSRVEAISPYAGLGLGLQLVAGESNETVRGPGVGVGSVDVGAGANAFIGLRIPMGRSAAVFAEGRAGLAGDVGQAQRDQLRIEGRGDYTGVAGLSWAF
jgi:hypothetical protein